MLDCDLERTYTARRSYGFSHMTTYSAKPSEIEKKWVVIDATGLVVGRLATIIAMRLRGKHKPTFTPHMDCGDNVIVVNAAKVLLTGQKLKKKVYYHHTGYIGGIKERVAGDVMRGKFPERILEKAVERMLPRGPLGRRQLANLRVYPGTDHPHAAQLPEALDVAKLNPKNTNFHVKVA
jgi:large subunit ribosomal protein L13